MHTLTQEQVESVKMAIWETFRDYAVVRVFDLAVKEEGKPGYIGFHVEAEKFSLNQVKRIWFDAWIRTMLKPHRIQIYFYERGQALRSIDQVAILLGTVLSEARNFLSSPRPDL